MVAVNNHRTCDHCGKPTRIIGLRCKRDHDGTRIWLCESCYYKGPFGDVIYYDYVPITEKVEYADAREK